MKKDNDDIYDEEVTEWSWAMSWSELERTRDEVSSIIVIYEKNLDGIDLYKNKDFMKLVNMRYGESRIDKETEKTRADWEKEINEAIEALNIAYKDELEKIPENDRVRKVSFV